MRASLFYPTPLPYSAYRPKGHCGRRRTHRWLCPFKRATAEVGIAGSIDQNPVGSLVRRHYKLFTCTDSPQRGFPGGNPLGAFLVPFCASKKEPWGTGARSPRSPRGRAGPESPRPWVREPTKAIGRAIQIPPSAPSGRKKPPRREAKKGRPPAVLFCARLCFPQPVRQGPGPDAGDDAHGGEQRHDGAAAVADKGQGQADHRHDE